jgi:hypothetical protein
MGIDPRASPHCRTNNFITITPQPSPFATRTIAPGLFNSSCYSSFFFLLILLLQQTMIQAEEVDKLGVFSILKE